MSPLSDLENLSLCYSTEKSEKVIADYVYIDGSGDLRSRAWIVPGPVSDPTELPNWNCDSSLTGEAPAYDGQVILKPQAIFRDPFTGGNNILVMCDAYTSAGEPIPTNKRYAAAKIFSHPDVVAEEPWYGFHQEYTLLQKPVGGFPGPQWPYYRVSGDDKAFGRDIVNAHYKACLYAGINISGINEEMMAGQGDFQVMPGQSVPAPASGISAGDQFWIARYILKRITDMLGVRLSFDPNPSPGYLEGAGARIIFSTKSMREVGCYEVSKIKLEKLRMKHKLDMAAYGEGKENRLPAKTVLLAFPYRGASLGAGSGTKGYIIEDRRPASNMDPYEVTSQIAKTTIIWKPTAFEILAAMIPFPRWMKRLFGRTCY